MHRHLGRCVYRQFGTASVCYLGKRQVLRYYAVHADFSAVFHRRHALFKLFIEQHRIDGAVQLDTAPVALIDRPLYLFIGEIHRVLPCRKIFALVDYLA